VGSETRPRSIKEKESPSQFKEDSLLKILNLMQIYLIQTLEPRQRIKVKGSMTCKCNASHIVT